MYKRLRLAFVALLGIVLVGLSALPANAWLGEVINDQLGAPRFALTWDGAEFVASPGYVLKGGDCQMIEGATLRIGLPDVNGYVHVTFDAATLTTKTADGDVWWSWFELKDANDNTFMSIPGSSGGDSTFNSQVMKRTYRWYDNHFETYIYTGMSQYAFYLTASKVAWMGHC